MIILINFVLIKQLNTSKECFGVVHKLRHPLWGWGSSKRVTKDDAKRGGDQAKNDVIFFLVGDF